MILYKDGKRCRVLMTKEVRKDNKKAKILEKGDNIIEYKKLIFGNKNQPKLPN